MSLRPDRTLLAPGLEISRVVTGLWQVADMERDGRTLDRDAAAEAMADYARGASTASTWPTTTAAPKLIAGRFLRMTRRGLGPTVRPPSPKWCPAPGPMTAEVVRAGIAERLERLGVEPIDLLQLHWWMFEHPATSTP